MQKTILNELFREALEAFVEKAKRDEQIIAVILLGSLSYDQVWEKSDIDFSSRTVDEAECGWCDFYEWDSNQCGYSNS